MTNYLNTAVTRIVLCACFCIFGFACRSNGVPAPKTAPQNGPDRVLVVINARSALSDSVGRYYVQRRGIKASHVVRIDVPVDDDVSELQYRARILTPVRAAIDSLPVRTDFIVLMKDVPLRIGGKNGYSVDAFLAGMRLLFPPMVGYDTTWLRRNQNPYFASMEPFNSDRFNMYLVTRIDCGQVADCLGLIDNAVVAKPVPGPFFFDAAEPHMSDPGYRIKNRSIMDAAQLLRALGADVILDTTARFRRPPQPVMGYVSWGSNDANFDIAAYHAIQFLPGAIAETFVSTSARTFGRTVGGQSLIVDLVRQGVTGVKGYVSEPYTVALVHPELLFNHYLRGFTLAESFYAASRLILWKDIVVGDPLCAPYAKPIAAPMSLPAATLLPGVLKTIR